MVIPLYSNFSIKERFFGLKLIVIVSLVGLSIVKVVVILSPGTKCPANQLVIGNDFEEKLNLSNPIAVWLKVVSAGVRIFLILS